MLGINGGEALILLLIAFFVIGPERVPQYAEKLREAVRSFRRYALDAKDDLKETLGPEVSGVDWRKLDPRQYDPRTIVREALMEEDDRDRVRDQPVVEPVVSPVDSYQRLPQGQRAPFDTEAT